MSLGIKPLGARVVIKQLEAEEKNTGWHYPGKLRKGKTADSRSCCSRRRY